MSYSPVSPVHFLARLRRHLRANLPVLNLSTTADTFDTKTQGGEGVRRHAEGAGFAQMQMLQQMMGGYAPGAEDYEVGLSAAARAKGKPEGQTRGCALPRRLSPRSRRPGQGASDRKLRRKRREPSHGRSVSPRLAPASSSNSPGSPISSTPWSSDPSPPPNPGRGTCTTTGTVHRPRQAVSPICSKRTSARLAPRPPARLAWQNAHGDAGSATGRRRTLVVSRRQVAGVLGGGRGRGSLVNVWNVDTGEVQRLTHPSAPT